MFLIFKPPQSYLQVQLLDPDGFKKKFYDTYELTLAKQILEERQTKRAKKIRSFDFKKRIKELLDDGATTIEIADTLSQEIAVQEPEFEFTPEMQAEVHQIMVEYKAQVQREARESVLNFIADLQAMEAAARELELQKIRELDNYNRYLEEKKRRDLKARKLKILFLLASLEDDDEV